MGNPDNPTPQHIVEKLIEAVQNPRTHPLLEFAGDPRSAARDRSLLRSAFRRGGSTRSARPSSLWGRRKALPTSPWRSPARATWCWSPTRPIRSMPMASSSPAGRCATSRSVPDVDFLAEIERAARYSVPAPLAVILSFPANPTAHTVDLAFYEQVVDFCRSARDLCHLRPRLCGDLLRRQPAAFGPADPRRQGYRRRVHLAQQDLFHARLAHRVCRRQRPADRRPGAGVKSYLDYGGVHADPGCGHRRAQRPAGLHRSGTRALPAPARRCGGELQPPPAGKSRRPPRRCSPGRRSHPGFPTRAPWNSPSCS